MSARAVPCPAAVASLRAPGNRSRKASWAAAGCPGPAKRRRLIDPHSGSLLLSLTAAAGQGGPLQPMPQQLHTGAAGLPAAQLSTQPAPSVLVAFEVFQCALQFGDGLRLAGSCAELGAWNPLAAPTLEWCEGDRWACQLALPPGQHTFKLVIIRQDGSQQWEEGDNRSLLLPELPAGTCTATSGSSGIPLFHVTASVGDTTATAVTVNQAQLQAATAAAAARVTALLVRRAELAARLAALETEVEQSEGKIAGIREDVQHMVSAELARLQQAQQAQQEVQHAQQAAVLAESAAVVASAYALMTDVAAGMAPEAEAEAKQAHAPVAAAAAAYAADEGAAVDVGSDGALSFHFGDADGKAGSSHPSALELAKQRLAVRLPAEAAAGLEKQLRRVASGSAAPRRHADLAAHALQPNVVPAGGLYGAGSTTERHPLSAKLHSLRQEVSAEVRQVARLADDFQKTLSLYNVRASLRGNHAHSGSPSASSSSCSRTSSCGASHSAPAIAAAPSAVDPWKKSSLPGAAAILAAHSLYTLGSLAWTVGRTAVPAGAARNAADIAVWLAVASAAAAPFL